MTYDKKRAGIAMKVLRIENGHVKREPSAKAAGVSESTMCEWELGNQVPRADSLGDTCRALYGEDWLKAICTIYAAAYGERP